MITDSKPMLLFGYPNTVSVVEENFADSCHITVEGDDTKYGICEKVEGARFIKIMDAFPESTRGKVTINVKLVNPKDNWGTIGLGIKTYQIDGEEEYLVDKLEGNELIPNLKCIAPCKECQEDENGIVVDQTYCTECWQWSSFKY